MAFKDIKKQRSKDELKEIKWEESKGIEIVKFELKHGMEIYPFIGNTTNNPQFPNYELKQAKYKPARMSEETKLTKIKWLADMGVGVDYGEAAEGEISISFSKIEKPASPGGINIEVEK